MRKIRVILAIALILAACGIITGLTKPEGRLKRRIRITYYRIVCFMKVLEIRGQIVMDMQLAFITIQEVWVRHRFLVAPDLNLIKHIKKVGQWRR